MKFVSLLLLIFFMHPGLCQDAVSVDFEKRFADAKLWEQPPEMVKQMVLDNSKGKPTEKIFQTFPKILDFFVALLRDKDALPGMFSILKKRKVLNQYLVIWLVLMVGAWWVKKNLFPREPNFFRRAFTSLIFTIGGSFLSFSLFYLFFKDEISPTVSILVSSFL